MLEKGYYHEGAILRSVPCVVADMIGWEDDSAGWLAVGKSIRDVLVIVVIVVALRTCSGV